MEMIAANCTNNHLCLLIHCLCSIQAFLAQKLTLYPNQYQLQNECSDCLFSFPLLIGSHDVF